jgi:transcriptional regulator with XRE-family HTH domain
MLTNTKVSEKIKRLRKKLNLSQDRFGKKIGISGKTISAYEKGRCEPPLKILEKISNIYGEPFLKIKDDKMSDLVNKIKQIKESLSEIENVFGI